MILPDINLLVYAHNEAAPDHERARAWLEDLLSGTSGVALPWAVTMGFVRLVTHPSVLEEPVRPLDAMRLVRSWLERPGVEIVDPGPRHASILETLFEATGLGGNLTTDTHLAALAIEHRCELHSNDDDFSRFPGLRWRNPLG